MPAFTLQYSDGREIRKGDRVLVEGAREAVVSLLLSPGCKESWDFSCPEGGFLLDFADGDVQVWPHANEDIELVDRQPT